MRKGIKIGKKLVALFLVLLLSIDSLAAVVGDNDGAAFITKAEFDSLKNDFQSELNKFNRNIDNKISDAINAYISGVKTIQRYKIISPYPDYLIDDEKETGKYKLGWWSGTTVPNETLYTGECLWTYEQGDRTTYEYTNTTNGYNYDVGIYECAIKYNSSGTNLLDYKTPPFNLDNLYEKTIIADKNRRILYFAKAYTYIDGSFKTWANTNPLDHTSFNILRDTPTFAKWDSWPAGARIGVLSCQTVIGDKLRTAVCPFATNQYICVEYGSNIWKATPKNWIVGTGGPSVSQFLGLSFSSGWYNGAANTSGFKCGGNNFYSIWQIWYQEGNNPTTKTKMNEFVYSQLYDTDNHNGQIKYGVYIGKTPVKGDLELKINVSDSGKIYLRKAESNGNAAASTQFAEKDVAVGDNTLTFTNINENVALYLIYKPVTTTSVRFINNLELTVLVS